MRLLCYNTAVADLKAMSMNEGTLEDLTPVEGSN